VSYTDYTTFGPPRSIGSEFTFSDTWSVSETVNKVVGKHAVKFGFEGRVMFNNQALPTSSFGNFAFTKGYTQRDALRAEAAAGNAFASLLLGIPASGSVPINAEPAYGNRYYVAFFQDDWRVSSRLTLNLGLRWDYESPLSERFDRQNRGFDAAAPSPLKAPGLDLRGGLLFTDSSNRLPFERDLNNWQPRLGVAYQLRSTTVLRAGYGINYLPTFDTGYNNGFSVTTDYVSSLDGGITPSGRWSNPYPAGLRQPYGRSLGLATMLGSSFAYGFPDRVIPYVHQYSFGFQQELPGRVLMDASYVGSRTAAVQTAKGINAVPACCRAPLTTGPRCRGSNCCAPSRSSTASPRHGTRSARPGTTPSSCASRSGSRTGCICWAVTRFPRISKPWATSTTRIASGIWPKC